MGIRMAIESNTVMWVNLLRHKYVGNKQFLDAPKMSGSFVWNSIMKAKAVLRASYEFSLGDGSSPLWSSPWIRYQV